MLQQFAGEGKIVAVVSDSYNLWEAIANIWGEQLKEQVINNGGTVVIRPDSGEPVEVVCRTIEMLMAKFGYTTNSKGYRLLPSYIRVIQGDGVSLASIRLILEAMTAKGLSADNIAFGMGAELLQKVNRDTLRFAMKASAIEIEGTWQDVFKDPITDPGKTSKKGRLALIKNQQDGYETVRLQDIGSQTNHLRPVFANGKLLVEDAFKSIRERSNQKAEL